ncbi:MAG: hypothetical protein MI924_11175 [Chloroflexales bacterium]|nr:hypothetical protein [Chloroflexales bacterium]
MINASRKGRTEVTVAIIGAIAVVVAAIIGVVPTLLSNNTSNLPETFHYQVRVQAATSGENISNARITIETGDLAPIDVYTDSNEFSQINIDANRTNTLARVVVEAPNYVTFTQNIILRPDELPDVIRLRTK